MKIKSKIKSQKSKLTEDEVKHVAKLANLTLTPQEVKKFQKQLSEVLDYIDVLKKLDTKKVEPTSQVTGLENIFRRDEIGESLQPKQVLSNAPQKTNSLFMVKAILQK
jgi:aspartyl-tRNA(Asn)/glutamyl-tRNA(Gln) amidotransferase subunit C